MKNLFTKIFITNLLGFYFVFSLSFAQEISFPTQEELQKALPPGIERVISIPSSYWNKPSSSSEIEFYAETLATGFFITEDLLVTNYYSIFNTIDSPQHNLGLVINGKFFPGVLAIYDKEHDLAIIKFEEKIGTPLELGNYKDLKLDDELTMYGFLMDGKIGTPIVGPSYKKLVHTFAHSQGIYESYHGTPALSEDGKVMVVMTLSLKDISFGTPVTYLKALLARMYAEGSSVVAQDLERAKYWDKQLALDIGSVYYHLFMQRNLPDSIVKVDLYGSWGTGFFIEEDLLVTNYHVVDDIIDLPEVTVRVKIDGETFGGGVVAIYDKENDLAIVKFEEKIGKPLELGNYKDLKLDDKLTVYSFIGMNPITGQASKKQQNKLTFSEELYKGYSGSPALSEDGKVMAIIHSGCELTSFGASVTQLKVLLAEMYSEGNSVVAQDSEKAEYWHEQWALDTGVSGQNEIAQTTLQGGGLPKDPAQIEALYDAYLGQFQLAQMYAEGLDGLPKDLKRAEYWYEQWALRGGDQAKYGLAEMYAEGSDGLSQDLKKAEYWYEQAISTGYKVEEAQEKLLAIRKLMKEK